MPISVVCSVVDSTTPEDLFYLPYDVGGVGMVSFYGYVDMEEVPVDS